jgi:hypothetical protein
MHWIRSASAFFVGILIFIETQSQDLHEIVPKIGNTFCTFLAQRNLIHRKMFGECSQPKCSWDTWNHALHGAEDDIDFSSKTGQRVVISYGHNGFGNMLWQHTVAFMVAESLKARLFIAMIPENLCFDGVYPPNTWEGQNAMNSLLPDEFEYHLLSANSSVRKLCDPEDYVVLDRPRDWRNHTYGSIFKSRLLDIVNDPKPRCVKMLGYFQNLPLCKDDSMRLWTPRMLNQSTM